LLVRVSGSRGGWLGPVGLYIPPFVSPKIVVEPTRAYMPVLY
jgi:hypothetical protein